MFLFTLSRHLKVQSARKHFALEPVIVVIRKKQREQLCYFFTVTQEGGSVSIVFQVRLLTHSSYQCDVT